MGPAAARARPWESGVLKASAFQHHVPLGDANIYTRHRTRMEKPATHQPVVSRAPSWPRTPPSAEPCCYRVGGCAVLSGGASTNELRNRESAARPKGLCWKTRRMPIGRAKRFTKRLLETLITSLKISINTLDSFIDINIMTTSYRLRGGAEQREQTTTTSSSPPLL